MLSNMILIENIQKYITHNVFDGQYKGLVSDDKIIQRYLQMIENKQTTPEVVSCNDCDVFFSWRHLDWDTKQLGKEVKRIDYVADQVDTREKLEAVFSFFKSNTDLCYVRLSERHPLIKKMSDVVGCVCFARKLMFYADFNIGDERQLNHQIELLSVLNNEKMARDISCIASSAFAVNRFTRDPAIPEAFVDAVYTSWTDSYLQSPESLLCYVINGRIEGFIAFKVCQDDDFLSYGFVDLVAVSESMRGQSIATALMDHLKNKLAQQGITKLFANVDEENTSSCRFFQSAGFQQFHAVYEYHWRK